MLAVMSTIHEDWEMFWDDLRWAEDVWASKLGDEGQREFELAVESMIRASVHPSIKDNLKQTWIKCSAGEIWPWDNGALRGTLWYVLRDPFSPTEQGVQKIMLALKPEEGSGKANVTPASDWVAMEAEARAFVEQLKYAILATMWQFVRCCSDYLQVLPASIRNHLYGDLHDLVLRELFRS